MSPIISFEIEIFGFTGFRHFHFVPELVILSPCWIWGTHFPQTVWGTKFVSKKKVIFICDSILSNHDKMSLVEMDQKSHIFQHAEQNIRTSVDNQVIPRICLHKALTWKQLTPAKKNPASLTGMKEAENAATYKGCTSANFID